MKNPIHERCERQWSYIAAIGQYNRPEDLEELEMAVCDLEDLEQMAAEVDAWHHDEAQRETIHKARMEAWS